MDESEGGSEVSVREHLLIMFAKAPVPGRVKTRLQPDYAPEQSASLYGAFLLDLAERLLVGSERHDGWLSLAGDREHPVIEEIVAMGVTVVTQTGESLGDRMADAIEAGLAAGYKTVTLIGSDSPTWPTALLEQGWSVLESHDAVLAPSFDGGFTSIGARRALDALRGPIAWSRETTLGETLLALRGDGVLSGLSGFWYDVDEAGDVRFLAHHLMSVLADDGRERAPRTWSWLVEHHVAGRGEPGGAPG